MIRESIKDIREIYVNSPYNNYLGMEIVSFEEESVVIALPVTPSLLNVVDSAHGGATFSLLDSAIGATVRMAAKQPVVTVSMSIHYFSPILQGDKMIASAEVLQLGNSLITAEGIVKDYSGTILAKATGTFKIIQKKSCKAESE